MGDGVAPGDSRRVLVVDDDPQLLRLVSQWLRDGGFNVTPCNSFNEAKQLLASAPPDVLVTDVRLGAFNGLQLVILVKEQHPTTRTVVMSAYDDPALRREADQCGASYLVKPFNSEAVLDLVRNDARVF
jgi:DNA-binding NtrC family response regulator